MQGEPNTPPAQAAGATSSCTTSTTIGNTVNAAVPTNSTSSVSVFAIPLPPALSSSITLVANISDSLRRRVLLPRAAVVPQVTGLLAAQVRPIRQSQAPLWTSACRAGALSSVSLALFWVHSFFEEPFWNFGTFYDFMPWSRTAHIFVAAVSVLSLGLCMGLGTISAHLSSLIFGRTIPRLLSWC